jgi:hypothetical protein
MPRSVRDGEPVRDLLRGRPVVSNKAAEIATALGKIQALQNAEKTLERTQRGVDEG